MRRKTETTAHGGSLTPTPIGLRDVLTAAPDVVFCCDYEGRWVWVSPSIEQLIGHKPADLIGHSCLAMIAPAERVASARALLRLRGQNHRAITEYECSAVSMSGHVVRIAFKVNRI